MGFMMGRTTMNTNRSRIPSTAPQRAHRTLYSRSGSLENVCILISRRSMGSFPKSSYNDHRINMDILKKIMCQKTTKFKKVWTKHSKAAINYVNGRIYFDNFSCCYSSFVCIPQKLYEMPKCSKSEKIEDAILCECPLGEPLAQASDYTPSILAVTGHDWLLRISADTGKILQKVFLGASRRFKYISWDETQATVVVTTIKKTCVYHNQQSNAIFHLAVFNVFPLSLVGVLEIDKDVFGSNVTNVMITNGVLTVMHSPGLVRLYSFERIVKECMQQQCVIGETCNWKGETGIVGDFPFGLPCNITVTERPPVLFEVACFENVLQVGGYPWHYIYTPNKKEKGTHHICSMDDHSLARNGIREMKFCSIEPDWIHFHPDFSERIIHVGPDNISVLKLKELTDDAYKYEVIEEFAIRADREPKADNKVTFTASGRMVKKRINQLDDDTGQEVFYAVMYEDELDLLMVVAVTHTEEDGVAHVDLHCNGTGRILKKIKLQEFWDVTHSHALVFDRDTVIHIEERPNHNFSCFVYKMHCGSED
ncbi:DDB1- and CUL4-associated factor 17 isoform 2-T2 [Anomaloglossus baeobatrachus]|uniref:DDB1- and CUL4-associated factor 17 isoform X1 n=2 Tax=Anomaloglossus baeobatrachus TaxID=238106 RepID=UPI003F4FC974